MTKEISIGLAADTVRLEPYSAQWPRLYAREARELKRHLGRMVVDVQHIGSTAVRGLAAKPIIDIAVQVRDIGKIKRITAALPDDEYSYKGEYGLAGRHFFVKGDPASYHVHVVDEKSVHWNRWLKFRDYLSHHPEARKDYEAFKKKLARSFVRDRDSYTEGKNPFVMKILKARRK